MVPRASRPESRRRAAAGTVDLGVIFPLITLGPVPVPRDPWIRALILGSDAVLSGGTGPQSAGTFRSRIARRPVSEARAAQGPSSVTLRLDPRLSDGSIHGFCTAFGRLPGPLSGAPSKRTLRLCVRLLCGFACGSCAALRAAFVRPLDQQSPEHGSNPDEATRRLMSSGMLQRGRRANAAESIEPNPAPAHGDGNYRAGGRKAGGARKASALFETPPWISGTGENPCITG
jgi:hypothetical protein